MDSPNEDKIPPSIEKTLRKGNINFDFLQPDEFTDETQDVEAANRRNNSRQGKRGLFNRGRPPRPFKRIHLYFAILFCFSQVAAITAIALSGQFLWILFIPILLTLFLGSLIMVTLLMVRPL
ncbi:hypothetical protein EHQ58_06515 [Leptospira ognonensis]|uniref:Uncharacterized protein n=1 Tax=Leptospira ognonensis TaxID=2484945 RepID=A0A4R9K4I8_9LEPT|nr:hypothetical protein [Leptospira ognonensis]TGL60150.1 hypothetical protein EHQ58_06515 [Leptospira ognonensis]